MTTQDTRPILAFNPQYKIATNPEHPDFADEIPVDDDGASCYEVFENSEGEACSECGQTIHEHEYRLHDGAWEWQCVMPAEWSLPFAEGGAYDGS